MIDHARLIKNITNDYNGCINIPLLKKIKKSNINLLLGSINNNVNKNDLTYINSYNFAKDELFGVNVPLSKLKTIGDKESYANVVALFSLNAINNYTSTTSESIFKISNKQHASRIKDFIDYIINFIDGAGIYDSFTVSEQDIFDDKLDKLTSILSYFDWNVSSSFKVKYDICLTQPTHFCISYFNTAASCLGNFHELTNNSSLCEEDYTRNNIYYDTNYIYFTEFLKIQFYDETKLSQNRYLVAYFTMLDILNSIVGMLISTECIAIRELKYDNIKSKIYRNNSFDIKYILLELSILMDIFKVSTRTSTLEKSVALSSNLQHLKIN